jgi:sporulation protein YlmC with PRC-barrel domain
MRARTIHAALDLLDRQIVDADDELVGKVDDVELSDPEDGPPRVVALLLGPQAYGHRLGGRLGRWIVSSAERIAGTSEPIRIPMQFVEELGVSITLKVRSDEIERTERLDHWLRDHLISRIPGARRASE